MNLVWIIGLVCLSAGVMLTQADPMAKRRFCGKHLADALSVACGGLYNGKKRNVPFAIGDMSNDDYQFESSPEDYNWPYLSSKAVAAIFGNGPGEGLHPRYRRGVVDECCHNPCTLTDLRAYCAVY